MNNSSLNLEKLQIVKLITRTIIFAFLMLIVSGDWHWIGGWVVCLWFLLQALIGAVYFSFKNPELLKERLCTKGSLNQKRWDKYILSLYFVLVVFWFIIIPLDVKRFHWSGEFPFYIRLLGIALLLFASFLMFKSLSHNSFASPLVRIQEDRKQHVVSTSVYSIIRHPLYLAGILAFLGIPMFLCSVWGCVTNIILTLLLVIRIFGEEKMLEAELEGYNEYKNKVKYRLIPFIW